MTRYLRTAAVTVAVLALVGVFLAAPVGPGPFALAWMTGDEPEARVKQFADAVARGDIAQARSLWVIGPHEHASTRERVEARQAETWRTLAGSAGRTYRIERVEWWGTCCMPHVIDSRTGAGAARYWIRFDGSDAAYVVTVMASGTRWMHDGAPATVWAVREVYLDGHEPIYLGRQSH